MDNRMDPKARKYPQLWQSYLFWDELKEARKSHILRISSIEAGKSNLDAQFEQNMIQQLESLLTDAQKQMVEYGQLVPVWDWMVGIKGIGDHTAAKILALYDDVERFSTISKFWRFGGHGIYDYWVDERGVIQAPKDGYKSRKAKAGEWIKNGTICEECTPGAVLVKKGGDVEPEQVIREHIVTVPESGWRLAPRADVRVRGWNSPYHNRLKSEIWLLGNSFIKQQTPVYIDLYYKEKTRLRTVHPEKIKINGRWKYNDGHLHNMAMRKMRKVFLAHLWVKWRESEGLPVSRPYVIEILGHTGYVEPMRELEKGGGR